MIGPDGTSKGVVMKDGTEVHSKVVLSNATPYVTFRQLTPQVIYNNINNIKIRYEYKLICENNICLVVGCSSPGVYYCHKSD